MALIRGLLLLRSQSNPHFLIPTLRSFSTSILSSDSKTPLSSKSKTRTALSLLKSESNPETILQICESAFLSPDTHLDRVALSLAVSSLSKSHNFSYIQTLIDRLRPDPRTERFDAHAIVLFGQANMIDHAVRVFKDYHAGSGRPGSVRCLNSLLFACVLCRNYSEMNRVYLEYPKLYNVKPDVDTYNRVVKGFCESGESGSAYSVLAAMDRAGVKPSAATFAEIVAGFYQEEKLGEVEKVLGMMKDKYGMHPGVGVYNVCVKGLCKLEKSKDAKELLERILKRGMKPNSVTYCELIHGFCREGDLEEAKGLFKRMVNRGCVPNGEVYYTLVYFLCKGGDFESALRVYKESMGKGLFPNATTMKALVNGLKGIGMVNEAKEIIGIVKEKFTKNLHVWEPVEAALADA